MHVVHTPDMVPPNRPDAEWVLRLEMFNASFPSPIWARFAAVVVEAAQGRLEARSFVFAVLTGTRAPLLGCMAPVHLCMA